MNWQILWIKVCLVVWVISAMGLNSLWSQKILLDQPLKAGEITLFQDLDHPDQFYYLPDKAQLAKDDNGNTHFSFLRYVENQRSEETSAREGEGGGILHAVVQIKVSERQMADARRILTRTHPNAEIMGPIMYQSGKFSLISSFVNPEGEFTESFLGVGNAPILEGNSAAVSIQLTKSGSKILWESFQTETPDISFSFEMDLNGYRAPHRAVLEADFEKIYEHEDFGGATASRYLAGEIRKTYDDLYQNGAIKLTQVGEDENLDELINTAYNKISALMFEPIQTVNNQQSLLDKATRMLSENRQEAIAINREIRKDNLDLFAFESNQPIVNAQQTSQTQTNHSSKEEERPECGATNSFIVPNHLFTLDLNDLGIEPKEEVKLPEYAFIASYEMRKQRQKGQFYLDLNKYISDRVTIRFDENIGNLNEYLGDERYFRQVNLDDPLFRQREVVAFVDGMNAEDFGKYINSVDVILQKKHQSGEISQEETRIDRMNFSRQGNLFKMTYGWKGDHQRQEWLNYDYKMIWNFFGGAQVEYPFQAHSSASINLIPPFQRKIISLELDPDHLKLKK
ncbi:MAG: hypothetical protein KDD63_21795, partial [Bacteroidetes bacterium]|nr:hypothetical protein [Bacteroidota bacterium]